MGAAYSSAPPSAGTTTPIAACSSSSAEEDISFAPPMHAGAAASPTLDPLSMGQQSSGPAAPASASSPSPAPPTTSGDMAAAAADQPRSSKPPRMVFDFLCFCALFLCLLLPWVGLPLYRRFVQVEVERRALQGRRAKKFDVLVPDVLADSDDDDGTHAAEDERQREARIRRSVGRQQSLAPGEGGDDDGSRSHISRVRRASRTPSRCCAPPAAATGPFFDWSWPSLLAAFHHAFPLAACAQRWARSEGTRWAETGRTLLAVVYSDKRYLMHPRFYGAAARFSVAATTMIAFLLLCDGVQLRLHDPLLYALRFHLCALGAFAAVSSVHSRGLTAGYKSVLRAREDDLALTRMRFVLDEDEDGHRTDCSRSGPDDAASSSADGAAPAPAPSPSSSSPSLPAPPPPRPSPPRLQSTNALLISRAIDSLSKQHKGAQLERRLVYILCMCLVRACIGGWGALAAGSSVFSSALHTALHCASGFAFFALAVQTEFELHDDLRRWAVFSAVHSATRAEALRLPFHVPLRCYPHSDNIVGWWQIRCYLKDLKGRFDFSRMQILLLAVGAQLASVAVAPLYISYAVAERPVQLSSLVEQLIAGSPLAAVDTALCLWLLLDMVAVGVAVNAACGRHAAMLQEQELQASFALSSAPRRDGDTGGERALKDSIKQLKALKERLTLVKESEKLAVWGFKLDERITTYLRTALVSYALLFAQTIFFKKRMDKEAHKAACT